ITYIAPGPVPCRAMRRKPLVLGLSVASVVAIAAPGWDVLIELWASPGSSGSSAKLAAAGSAAAVLALVAGPIGHHQHAAFGAGRRAFVRVARFEGLRIGKWRREAHRFGHRRRYRRDLRGRSGNGCCSVLAVQLQIIGGNETPAEPPRDVVEHRRNKTNVRIRGDAGRLEARVEQFVDEDLEGHAILQAERNGEGQAVHDARERRALFGHLDEDFAGAIVLVHAYGDVAFVAADAEFVGYGSAFGRHLLALRARKKFTLHRVRGSGGRL